MVVIEEEVGAWWEIALVYYFSIQHSDRNLPVSTCTKIPVQSGQSLSKYQPARRAEYFHCDKLVVFLIQKSNKKLKLQFFATCTEMVLCQKRCFICVHTSLLTQHNNTYKIGPSVRPNFISQSQISPKSSAIMPLFFTANPKKTNPNCAYSPQKPVFEVSVQGFAHNVSYEPAVNVSEGANESAE